MNRDLTSFLTVGGVSFLILAIGFWLYSKVEKKILSTWSIEEKRSYYKQVKLSYLLLGCTIMGLFINLGVAFLIGGLSRIALSVTFLNSNVGWSYYMYIPVRGSSAKIGHLMELVIGFILILGALIYFLQSYRS